MKDMEYGAAYSACRPAPLLPRARDGVVPAHRPRACGCWSKSLHRAPALAFGTLAIPLAFDGRPTSAAAGARGRGDRLDRHAAVGGCSRAVFGYALQLAAGVALLADAPAAGTGTTPVPCNGFYVGTAFLASAAACSARPTSERNPRRAARRARAISPPTHAARVGRAVCGGTRAECAEIIEHVGWDYRQTTRPCCSSPARASCVQPAVQRPAAGPARAGCASAALSCAGA